MRNDLWQCRPPRHAIAAPSTGPVQHPSRSGTALSVASFFSQAIIVPWAPHRQMPAPPLLGPVAAACGRRASQPPAAHGKQRQLRVSTVEKVDTVAGRGSMHEARVPISSCSWQAGPFACTAGMTPPAAAGVAQPRPLTTSVCCLGRCSSGMRRLQKAASSSPAQDAAFGACWQWAVGVGG